MGTMDFDDFVSTATDGALPYPYQRRLARDGLPDVLRAPTGAGKTLAAVLPWLYRRLAGVESARWLVVVLPQRSLVEQTVRVARSWVANLGLDVPVHVLMGGEDDDSRSWKMDPNRVRLFVGTQDMVLSRLLMRGYAESRTSWPMSFGLLHAGTQFVFDEVQLMGPALPTSLQLQGLRETLGTALPCRSMWMSATLAPERLRTVDFHRALSVVELDAEDRDGALRRRLEATRRVDRLDLPNVDVRTYPKLLADNVLAAHRPGTRTLVVLNTVDRAVAVHAELRVRVAAEDLVLLHARFRPGDRQRQAERAVNGTGIVVATQVLEAGVDMTSTTLVTELAPWSSIVQRAGRCNRDGAATDARLLWVAPPPGRSAPLPYDAAELDNAAETLTSLDGQALTGTQLAAASEDIVEPVHPVLRRRDLRDLFDTAPDLDGNDIDVGPFIRDADDRTVLVAWRALPMAQDAALPARVELCPAPVAGARDLLARSSALVFDQQEGHWRRAVAADIRATAMLVFDAARGGYLPDIGFSAASREPIAPIEATGTAPDAVDIDPQSTGHRTWLSLAEHLADTEQAARILVGALEPDLSAALCDALVAAARWHDLGKAHPTFQTSLVKANPDQPPPDGDTVWAKSPGRAPLRPEPPHFRHELVTALLLLDEATGLLSGITETDLVVYLALAHHGKIRLAVRAAEGEPEGTVLGVVDGSSTLPARLRDGGVLVGRPVSLAPTRLGVGSLTDRALRLRDRGDLGPFRLAFCEAIVQCADWQASARRDGHRG
ncbi:MAG TPA: CRISPR-associated helicase Cas3' [Pseudonocardiaceae bacterium]|nr:CRISPR-associated helicase Cas3' [Pseudonocardiaceae bacterium]